MTKEKFINIGLFVFFLLLPWQIRWEYLEFTTQHHVTEYGTASVYLTQILLIIIFLIFLTGRFRKKHERLVLIAALTLIPITISLSFAINADLALNAFIQYTTAIILFIVLLDRRVNWRLILIGFVCGLIIPAALGIYQTFVGMTGGIEILGIAPRDALRAGEAVIQIGSSRFLRATGGFVNPNILGGFLAVGLIISAGFAKNKRIKKYKTLLVLLTILFGIGLLFSFSQSAWLGLALAVAVGIVGLHLKKSSQYKAAIIALVVLAIASAFAYMLAINFSIGEGGLSRNLEARSMQERVDQYEDYGRTFPSTTNLFFGSGIGNYVPMLFQQIPNRQSWQYQPIHNTPLLIFAELGIFGFIMIGYWIFATIKSSKNHYSMLPGIALVFALFFDHYLWTSWSGLALCTFVLAIMVKLEKKTL